MPDSASAHGWQKSLLSKKPKTPLAFSKEAIGTTPYLRTPWRRHELQAMSLVSGS